MLAGGIVREILGQSIAAERVQGVNVIIAREFTIEGFYSFLIK